METAKSKFGTLKTFDFWKGLIVAILTAGITSLESVISSATDFVSFNWQGVVLAAAGAFVAYIIKQFITNSDGQILKKEN